MSTKLTDEELLAAPIKFLDPVQRKRRRKLKADKMRARKDKVRKARDAKKIRVERGVAKVIFCQAVKKDGDPCNGYALNGAKHCLAHLNDAERVKLNKHKSLNKYGEEGRKRLRGVQQQGATKSAPQTARMVMEVAVEKLLQRYFRAVGLEFRGFDEEGTPIVFDNGAETGLRIYGESKDGYIEMSNYPDLVAQIHVIEKLWDRVYGKPKQTQVLEGGSKPVQVQPVRTVERAQKMGALLRQVGAIPHEGRHRPETPDGPTPADPVDTAGDESPGPDNVVPLHDRDE